MKTADNLSRRITGSIRRAIEVERAGEPLRLIDCRLHYRVQTRERSQGLYPGSPATAEIERIEPLSLGLTYTGDDWQEFPANDLPPGESLQALATMVAVEIDLKENLQESIDLECLRDAGEA